jgi:hypothetical protein
MFSICVRGLRSGHLPTPPLTQEKHYFVIGNIPPIFIKIGQIKLFHLSDSTGDDPVCHFTDPIVAGG